METSDKIYREKFEQSSGAPVNWLKEIKTIKDRDYFVLKGIFPGGDQPKSFIKVYEYGNGRRANKSQWTSYIAKFPKKWYPLESVTEHLLTRVGQIMGMNMAESHVVVINGQVRFLSKYFLKRNERLVHGADIYSMYLNDDKFIEDVDKLKMERQLISYEFATEAISKTFPEQAEELIKDFTKMLIFDSLIGVNDRHFYNWGIVVDVKGEKEPKFSPLYDTSRGLLWNEKESKLKNVSSSKKMQEDWIELYINKSMPKICLEEEGEVNHFDFLSKLLEKNQEYVDICSEYVNSNILNEIHDMIDLEFSNLFSDERKNLIKLCLFKRFEHIKRLIN